MREWRIPPWANHIVGAIPCSNARTHSGYRFLPPATAHRWFPLATLRLQARVRRCASSHGPSKNEGPKNPGLRSSCQPTYASSPASPHTREAHRRLAAGKATKAVRIVCQARGANTGDSKKMNQGSFAQRKLFDDIDKRLGGFRPMFAKMNQGSFDLCRVN